MTRLSCPERQFIHHQLGNVLGREIALNERFLLLVKNTMYPMTSYYTYVLVNHPPFDPQPCQNLVQTRVCTSVDLMRGFE